MCCGRQIVEIVNLQLSFELLVNSTEVDSLISLRRWYTIDAVVRLIVSTICAIHSNTNTTYSTFIHLNHNIWMCRCTVRTYAAILCFASSHSARPGFPSTNEVKNIYLMCAVRTHIHWDRLLIYALRVEICVIVRNFGVENRLDKTDL